jgi:phage/plasmid-associated DNA primase
LREEASGIMAWALAGAVRLIRNGKYTRPASTEESKKEWIADADNVAGWCEEHVTKTTPRDDAPIIDKTSNGVAYRRYHDWCRATGRKPSAQNTFFKRLKRLGHIKGRTEEERFWYFSCTETDIPISIR